MAVISPRAAAAAWVNIASEISKWLLECDPQVRLHSWHIWATRTEPCIVREALLRLEEEGLVVIKPQSGTYVAAIDVERAAEARFLRLSVEIEVVKNLCKGVGAAERTELAAILDRQRFCAQAGERDDFSRQDSGFHMTMYRIAGATAMRPLGKPPSAATSPAPWRRSRC